MMALVWWLPLEPLHVLPPEGCDIAKDTIVLRSGEHIGNPEIGLLATVGVTMVKVYPRPTIAVLSTGDELVEPGTETLSRGQVLMKPGKPVTFAQISVSSRNEKDSKTVLAFGLPGNPVSCSVCFNLFAVPAIRHLSGWSNPHLQRVQACLKNYVKPHPARPEYHRAVVRWEFNNATGSPGFVAESTGQQMSSRLLSMKSANALLELPATGQILPAGTSVQAILISDISSFPRNKSSGSTSISLHQKHAVKSNSTCKQMDAASPEKVMVAILTVSDMVASGAGPDRRKTKKQQPVFCTFLAQLYF